MSPLVMDLTLAPSFPVWWAIVGVAPSMMEYLWQVDLFCSSGELEEGFHVVFQWLECVQRKKCWKLGQCCQGWGECPLLLVLLAPLVTELVWRTVLDIVATCRPPNIVWYQAYKIIGTNIVLMPGQCSKHQCRVGPNRHSLPDHRIPVLCCPTAPKAICCSQIGH